MVYDFKQSDTNEELKQYYLLDSKIGDVNGDGSLDRVYLIGSKPFPDSELYENITLIINTGKNNKIGRPLPENTGYNPRLFLGKFNYDKADEILVTIDSGGSGGFTYSYLISYLNNNYQVIFDTEKYSELYNYTVNYLDYYRIKVVNTTLKQFYIFDITGRGREYLSEIYYPNGKLKNKIEGFVSPVQAVFPIDLNNDNIFELQIEQGVSGQYRADGFGFMLTWLSFKDNKQELQNQQLSLYPMNYEDK